MKLSIDQIGKNIQKIMSLDLEGHDKEENLNLVSKYLINNCLEVKDEDYFLEALLHERKLNDIEKTLREYVIEFMEESNESYSAYDRLEDVA